MRNHFQSSRWLAAILMLTGVVAAAFGGWSCSPAKIQSVTYAALPTGSSALVYIARDQGFFADNGLDVDVKHYDTGVATVDALLKGDVDIAWAAELPFIRRAFAEDGISIFAVVNKFGDQYLFGRKDRGIQSIPDLNGKKIGVAKGTIAEFYLARFLQLNGVAAQNVTIVDVQPPEFADSIVSGKVDAVVAWRPATLEIRAQMADRAVDWWVQSNQKGYGLVLGRNDWIRSHPELITRFLKALAQAEDYLIREPEGAKAIVQKQTKYDDAYMEGWWPETEFSLTLDQSLIAAMEDEARWIIGNNLGTVKTVPDFLDYVYEDGLKAVKPEAVNIAR